MSASQAESTIGNIVSNLNLMFRIFSLPGSRSIPRSSMPLQSAARDLHPTGGGGSLQALISSNGTGRSRLLFEHIDHGKHLPPDVGRHLARKEQNRIHGSLTINATPVDVVDKLKFDTIVG